MKKYLPASLCTLFLSMVLFSCTADYQDLGERNISELLVKHQWNVQVINSNTAYDFKDFTLGFDQRGLAVFNMNTIKVTGSWNVVNENISLQLNASEAKVQQLNRSWNMVSKSTESIRFTSADPMATEQLLLTRH